MSDQLSVEVDETVDGRRVVVTFTPIIVVDELDA